MILQHKIIFITLLSQSFICIGMKNSDFELIAQDMRAYGDNIQNNYIAFGQKTNSSFDRLKSAKKQNLCHQNAIVIEQPKRFKTSTQQEEQIIDITALFQEEKTLNPADHFNDQTLGLFYFFAAHASGNKKDYVSYGLKYIEQKEKMLEQKVQTRRDTPLKELEALKKKEKGSDPIESTITSSTTQSKQSNSYPSQRALPTPPSTQNLMESTTASSSTQDRRFNTPQRVLRTLPSPIYLPYSPAERDLNELQKKLHNKHKLESNENYNDWLEKEEKKLQDSFKNITPSPNNINYASLYHPPYMKDMQANNFFLFKALLSEQKYDHETYGRAYTESIQKQYKTLKELRKTPLTANKKNVIDQSQKSSVEKLSDEPDMFENCSMCIAGTTFWAGTAWAIGTLLKVLSQVK